MGWGQMVGVVVGAYCCSACQGGHGVALGVLVVVVRAGALQGDVGGASA